MSQISSEDLVTGFASLGVGVFFGMILSNEYHTHVETRVSVPTSHIADCAVIKNPEMRHAEGEAVYKVTFVDGVPQDITCVSQSTNQ